MAMTPCSLEVQAASDAAAIQIPQLRYEAIQLNAQNDPYAGSMDGGTDENSQGDTVKTLVMDRIDLGQNHEEPVFENSTTVCGKKGAEAKFGSSEFSSQMQASRGQSPRICLKGARTTVVSGYDLAVQKMKSAIATYMQEDNRAALFRHSGLKYVAKIGGSIASGLTGSENVPDADFIGGVPTAPLTFQTLLNLARELDENYEGVQWFDSGANQNFRVIVDSMQSDILRKEAGVYSDFQAATTGSFNDAKNMLWQYQFNPLYRGLKIGIDRAPRRFNEVDANGFPVWIPRLIPAAADHGNGKAIINPAWRTALYSSGMLISKGAFKRYVPTKWTDGPSDMKFNPQNTMGELFWLSGAELSCNEYRDYGQYFYEIERRIAPVVPHGVIAFTYKRCVADLGLSACPATDII